MKDALEQLAELSRLGDIHAMMALGEWFRGKLSEPYLELERDWESDPAQNKERIEGYTREHEEEFLYARAGIAWLIRASVYGNDQAARLVSEHKYWNAISLIPERFYFPGSESKISVSGTNLRKAGFLAFSGKYDCIARLYVPVLPLHKEPCASGEPGSDRGRVFHLLWYSGDCPSGGA